MNRTELEDVMQDALFTQHRVGAPGSAVRARAGTTVKLALAAIDAVDDYRANRPLAPTAERLLNAVLERGVPAGAPEASALKRLAAEPDWAPRRKNG